MYTRILRTSLRRIDSTARVPRTLWRIRIQFVGTSQFALVLETFCLHRFLALRCFQVQLLGLRRLTISLGCASIGFSPRAFCLRPLVFSRGLSSTNIMFGLGSLLPDLRTFFPLPFALLRSRLAADDDDLDDDQDHNNGDNDPDDS
jgi:hypothetical protein